MMKEFLELVQQAGVTKFKIWVEDVELKRHSKWDISICQAVIVY